MKGFSKKRGKMYRYTPFIFETSHQADIKTNILHSFPKCLNYGINTAVVISVYKYLHLVRIECTVHLLYVIFIFNPFLRIFCFHFSVRNTYIPSINIFSTFKSPSAEKRGTRREDLVE